MDGYKTSQVSNCDLASSVTVGYFSLAGAGDFEKLYRYIRNGSSDRRLRFIPTHWYEWLLDAKSFSNVREKSGIYRMIYIGVKGDNDK